MAIRYRNKAVQDLEGRFLDILELEAQAFLDDILGGTTYTNRRFNLYDSFGYGIYLNGKLIRTNAKSRQQRATEPSKKWYGRRFWGHKLLMKTFSDNGYKPSLGKGYIVVFAATMPYTNVLQYGKAHGLSEDYHVIAYMHTELRNFGKKYFKFSLVEDVKDGNYQAWNNGGFIPSKFA